MSEWIKHDGSVGCPLHPKDLISVKWSHGARSDNTYSGNLNWPNVLEYKITAPFVEAKVETDLDKIFVTIPKFHMDDEIPTGEELTGLSSSYYDVTISKWTNEEHQQDEPVTICCNDIIEALDMNYAQGNVFKAQWRIAAFKQGKCKKGNSTLYDAEKSYFFSNRVLVQETK